MAERAIINASPLIFLSRGGHLDLLRVFAKKIWAPEPVADYCSGTNHVLPTYGAARSYSGLGVDQFMRQMTVQELTGEGLRSLAPTVLELSALEGLDAHGEAVRIRLLDAVRKAG